MEPDETLHIELQVRRVLMELLKASESDSVRVSAAKALMDRIDKRNKNEEKQTEETAKDKEEREAALSEAFRLLAQITDIKSNCTSGAD